MERQNCDDWEFDELEISGIGRPTMIYMCGGRRQPTRLESVGSSKWAVFKTQRTELVQVKDLR